MLSSIQGLNLVTTLCGDFPTNDTYPCYLPLDWTACQLAVGGLTMVGGSVVMAGSNVAEALRAFWIKT